MSFRINFLLIRLKESLKKIYIFDRKTAIIFLNIFYKNKHFFEIHIVKLPKNNYSTFIYIYNIRQICL